MKIAVLGDIRGNVRALEAVLAEAAKAGCEKIFHTGDIFGPGPQSNATIDRIQARHIEGVRGELDDEAVWGAGDPASGRARAGAASVAGGSAGSLGFSERRFLRDLPFSLQPALGERPVTIFHASPIDLYQPIEESTPEARLAELAEETGADVHLFGHSLKPFHRVVGGRHFICAGSVGRSQDGDPRACLAVVDLGRIVEVEFHRVAYGVGNASS